MFKIYKNRILRHLKVDRETTLDNKLKKADGETQKYRQLYNQERNSMSELNSEFFGFRI